MPDVRQQYDYDCGAAAVLAVTRGFSVGDDDEADVLDALGTTEEDGTPPPAVVKYLRGLGLSVAAQDDLNAQALANCTDAGFPVLCVIQDWESDSRWVVEEESGHWVVVIGVSQDWTITIQDPEAGRVEMPGMEFLSRWQDQDDDGEYVHFGIVVGPAGAMLPKLPRDAGFSDSGGFDGVRHFCGGEGGKPGPCPSGGTDTRGDGSAHKPTNRISQALSEVEDDLRQDVEPAVAKSSKLRDLSVKVAGAVVRLATPHVLSEFPVWATETCDLWMQEHAMNASGGAGMVMAGKVAAFAALKAWNGAKAGIAKIRGFADVADDDLDAVAERLHKMMSGIGKAAGFPVPSADELREQLVTAKGGGDGDGPGPLDRMEDRRRRGAADRSRIDRMVARRASVGRKQSYCGGEGGKPGPCPTGITDDTTKKVRSKIGGHDVVMEVGADGAAKVVEGPSHLVGKTFKKKAGPSPAGSQPSPTAEGGSSLAELPRKSKAAVTMDDNSATANKAWSKVSGGLETQDAASIVGAPDDAAVSIFMGKTAAIIDVEHPAYTAQRVLKKDEKGNSFISNDKFFLKEGKEKGTGLGSKVFSDQVANLSATADKTGIKYIACSAARDLGSGKQANGYYTWPRMGYDQKLDDYTDATPKEKETLATAAKKFGASSVLDVMSTQEGRDWWKTNGCDLRNMKFDLDGGSRSMKIHKAYLAERAAR